MKKLILASTLILFSCMNVSAQDSLKPPVNLQIQYNGATVYANQSFPKEILGEYYRQKKGNMITQLNGNGTGYLHMNGILHPIQFWIVTNEAGSIKKEHDFEGNYTMQLMYRYSNETIRGMDESAYHLTEVLVNFSNMYAIIMKDRFHKFTL